MKILLTLIYSNPPKIPSEGKNTVWYDKYVSD